MLFIQNIVSVKYESIPANCHNWREIGNFKRAILPLVYSWYSIVKVWRSTLNIIEIHLKAPLKVLLNMKAIFLLKPLWAFWNIGSYVSFLEVLKMSSSAYIPADHTSGRCSMGKILWCSFFLYSLIFDTLSFIHW